MAEPRVAWDASRSSDEATGDRDDTATMRVAQNQLGINPQWLIPKPIEAFSEVGLPLEVIELRFEWAEQKRLKLCTEVERRYDALKGVHNSGQESTLSVPSPGCSTPPGSTSTAMEARRLDVLARRREQEIQRLVGFEVQLRQRDRVSTSSTSYPVPLALHKHV